MSLSKPFISTYYSGGRDICLQQLEDRFNMLNNESAVRNIRKQLQNIRINEQYINNFKPINTRNVIANIEIQRQAYNRLLNNQSVRKMQRYDQQKKEKIEAYQLIESQKSKSKLCKIINKQLSYCTQKELGDSCQFSLNNKANLQLKFQKRFITQHSKRQLAYSWQSMNKNNPNKKFDKNIRIDCNEQQICLRQAEETVKRSYLEKINLSKQNQIVNYLLGTKELNVIDPIIHKSIQTRDNKSAKICNLQEKYKFNKLTSKPSNKYVKLQKSDFIILSALQSTIPFNQKFIIVSTYLKQCIRIHKCEIVKMRLVAFQKHIKCNKKEGRKLEIKLMEALNFEIRKWYNQLQKILNKLISITMQFNKQNIELVFNKNDKEHSIWSVLKLIQLSLVLGLQIYFIEDQWGEDVSANQDKIINHHYKGHYKNQKNIDKYLKLGQLLLKTLSKRNNLFSKHWRNKIRSQIKIFRPCNRP